VNCPCSSQGIDALAVFVAWRDEHEPESMRCHGIDGPRLAYVLRRDLSLDAINEFLVAHPELAHINWHGGHSFRYWLPQHISQARFGDYTKPAPSPDAATLRLATKIVSILGDCPGALDVVVRALQAQVRRWTR